ncbi:MAG TPA: hypothetical protein VGJ20_10835 [Xanthobacteraceae bacterium]|jgi:hypothetical protein
MPTLREFIKALAVGGAVAIAGDLIANDGPVRAQQIDPMNGHF